MAKLSVFFSKLNPVYDTLIKHQQSDKLHLHSRTTTASPPPLCNFPATITNALPQTSTDDTFHRLHGGWVSHDTLHL
jgi:hypothetical protein